jgi:acyl carrier protein
MSARGDDSPESRVTEVVGRLLAQRSISAPVSRTDDLRHAGLTSLDMISLVLSVEAEFDLTVPEESIHPANFRTIEGISRLVESLLEDT